MILDRRAPADFLQNPQAAYVAGENWIFFGVDPQLFGYAIWGRPAPGDLAALVQVLEGELIRGPHAVIIDFADVSLVSRESFEALASYTSQHRVRLGAIVSHAAIVRPTGVVGAVVSGFFEVVSRPFSLSYCTSVEAAAQCLGRGDATELAAAITQARQAVAGEGPLLHQLRIHLAGHLGDAEISGAARAVGVSVRTLQRRLGESSSSFAAELRRARLEAAKRLLLETDLAVTTVAVDVGFPSSQQFSTAFKGEVGCTPSAYRSGRNAG